MDKKIHIPVMVKEVLEYLAPEKGIFFLDATTGGGGHSIEILKGMKRDAVLVCNDWDTSALRVAKERLLPNEKNVMFVSENFSEVEKISELTGIEKFDGCLLDLGVSSLQLDDPGRGFSFRFNAVLDMRMSEKCEFPAKYLVNKLPEGELARIIKVYGEERYAKKIARAIVEARGKEEITSTFELAEIVRKNFKSRKRIDPATKTFQALRIVVNNELENLTTFLSKIHEFMKKDARLVIISFHSLEDRIIKITFKKWQSEGIGEVLTKHPVIPSEDEVKANPRSRSAKLRAFIFRGEQI